MTTAAGRISPWPLAAIAVAVVWLPFIVPLAISEWFQVDEYRIAWLRGLHWRPGALLASLLVLPFDTVATPIFQWVAGIVAVLLCLVVVYLAMRWPRPRPWIFAAAGVVSLLQALLTAWAATHG